MSGWPTTVLSRAVQFGTWRLFAGTADRWRHSRIVWRCGWRRFRSRHRTGHRRGWRGLTTVFWWAPPRGGGLFIATRGTTNLGFISCFAGGHYRRKISDETSLDARGTSSGCRNNLVCCAFRRCPPCGCSGTGTASMVASLLSVSAAFKPKRYCGAALISKLLGAFLTDRFSCPLNRLARHRTLTNYFFQFGMVMSLAVALPLRAGSVFPLGAFWAAERFSTGGI